MDDAKEKFIDAYERSPHPTHKHSAYFDAYPNLLAPYVGKSVTLVEVGLFKGGSLFMWREFLGSQARIIGIDIEPTAVKWRQFGFEIFIGDQEDPKFWEEFFCSVGQVDVLVDDGGHENTQQISTVVNTIDFIRDGGLLIIEDTHCSYRKDFGNPHPFSFIRFSFHLVDWINERFFGTVDKYGISSVVHSVQYFQSMVVLHVDRNKAQLSNPTSNLSARLQEKKESPSELQNSMTNLLRQRLVANLIIIPRLFLKNFKGRNFF
jgi:hypothetical protein